MSTTKVAIIGLLSTLVMARAAGDTIVGNKDNTITKELNESEKSIQYLCKNTAYSQTCIDRLSKGTNSSDTRTLMKVGFKLIFNEIENVMEYSERVSNYTAIRECCHNYLYDSFIGLLKAFDRVGSVDTPGSDITKISGDLQRYLKGIFENMDLCIRHCCGDEPDHHDIAAEMSNGLKVAVELTVDGMHWAENFPQLMKNSNVNFDHDIDKLHTHPNPKQFWDRFNFYY